jgi:hypothetical protein
MPSTSRPLILQSLDQEGHGRRGCSNSSGIALGSQGMPAFFRSGRSTITSSARTPAPDGPGCCTSAAGLIVRPGCQRLRNASSSVRVLLSVHGGLELIDRLAVVIDPGARSHRARPQAHRSPRPRRCPGPWHEHQGARGIDARGQDVGATGRWGCPGCAGSRRTLSEQALAVGQAVGGQHHGVETVEQGDQVSSAGCSMARSSCTESIGGCRSVSRYSVRAGPPGALPASLCPCAPPGELVSGRRRSAGRGMVRRARRRSRRAPPRPSR